MMRIAALRCTALALAFAGCASLRPVPGRPGADPDEERICVMERATGSHQFQEVCRTRAQIERERDEAEEMLHRGIQRGEIVIY